MPNNVKSCKKVDENTQTAKFTVFTLWNQLRSAKNKENNEIFANLKRELLKIFTYYTPSRGIVGKKRDPRIQDPVIFSGKIRKNRKNSEK